MKQGYIYLAAGLLALGLLGGCSAGKGSSSGNSSPASSSQAASSAGSVSQSEKITYEQILRRFFEIHDPTQLNRQGPDVGTQYRSAVFYTSGSEKFIAEHLIDELKGLGYKVVTTVEKAGPFYEAEAYHQNFAARTGRGGCHLPVKRFEQRAD